MQCLTMSGPIKTCWDRLLCSCRECWEGMKSLRGFSSTSDPPCGRTRTWRICLHHVWSMCCHDSFICVRILVLVSLSWIFALDSPVWICYGKKVEVVVIHQISRLGFSTSLQKYISVSLALEKMPSLHVLNWKDLFSTSVTSFSIV